MESLRLYPPASNSERKVSQEYSLELKDGRKVTLPLGSFVYFPIWSIQRSEEHYHNPNDFIPERFLPDQKKTLNPMIWLPFGHGPRSCIGMRMALLNIKTALSALVLNFKFEKGPKTMEVFDVSATNDDILITPDVFIKFTSRK
jgi:cytochrome P450